MLFRLNVNRYVKSIQRYSSRRFQLLLPIAIVLCVSSSSLASQVRFSQPIRKVDIVNYKTIEECSALLVRIKDSVQRRDTLSDEVDTFPIQHAASVKRTPLPEIVSHTARTCMAQFEAGDIKYDDFSLAVPLLLDANRDEEVEQLAKLFIQDQRFLKDTSRALLNHAINAFLNARPARYESAIRFLEIKLDRPEGAIDEKALLFARGAEISMLMGDSARAVKFLNQSVSLFNQPSVATTSASSLDTRADTRNIISRLMRSEMLDSLRKGTEVYAALRRSDERFMKQRSLYSRGTVILNIGDSAAPLRGDYWYSAGDSVGRQPDNKPEIGKATLIVFLSQGCRRQNEEPFPVRMIGERESEGCSEQYAVLKRLKQKFPELALIIATKTTGYYWPIGTTKPEVEARYLYDWWLGYHRIPAELIVSVTPFWRLADPDRRRIDEVRSIDTDYDTTTQAAVLVGPDGAIVDWFERLGRVDEGWIGEVLAVLMR